MVTKRKIDVLAVGDGNLDLVIKVDKLPSHDQKAIGQLIDKVPGGTVANFACAASQLGLQVTSLSNLGDDSNGKIILDSFKRFGVDTSLIQVRENQDSHFAVIMLDETGEKSLIFVPAFEEQYSLELAKSVMSDVQYLYAMPRAEKLYGLLADIAHSHAAEVMIDIEPTVCADRTHMKRLLKLTDIACFNYEGFLSATGKLLTKQSMSELLDLGPHTIVVTKGKDGVIAVTREEYAEVSAFSVPVVDTTGAGDTFNAAFLTATLNKKNLRDRLLFASAAAAISITEIGPRGNLPTSDAVNKLIISEG
jgi:sulfofructose kinase